VTYAARSPAGAQTSFVAGSVGPPAIRPPDETSFPSPLQASGPPPAFRITTCRECVARSRTTRLPRSMNATRAAGEAAAGAVASATANTASDSLATTPVF
jgi:hypothetical protein